MKESEEKLIEVLLKVKSFVTDDSDSIWCGYDTPLALRNDIDSYIRRVQQSDFEVLDTLNIEFIVTGTFQEHSLSNGWSREFLEIAAEFDRIYADLKKKK